MWLFVFHSHSQRSQVSCVSAGVRGASNGSRNALQTPFPLRMYTAMVGQGNAPVFVLLFEIENTRA